MTDRTSPSRRELLSTLGTVGAIGAFGVGPAAARSSGVDCSGDLRSIECGERASGCIDDDDPAEEFSCGPGCAATRHYEPVTFDGEEGCDVTVTVDAFGGDAGTQLLAPDGTVIGRSETGDDDVARIETTLGSTGAHGVKVYATGDASIPQLYRLTVDCVCEGNSPPIAAFDVSPPDPDPGERVTLDGTPSRDPDGSLVSYEWDVDGDGTYEYDGTTVPALLPDGETTVALRVVDDDGAVDATSKTVHVDGEENPSLSVDGDTTTSGETATVDLTLFNPGPAIVGNDEAVSVTLDWRGGDDALPPGWTVADVTADQGEFDRDTWSDLLVGAGDLAAASVTFRTAADATGEFAFDCECATAADPDAPLATATATITVDDGNGGDGDGGAVDRADANDDGDVDTGELQDAIGEWVRGEYSTADLQAIVRAWALSG